MFSGVKWFVSVGRIFRKQNKKLFAGSLLFIFAVFTKCLNIYVVINMEAYIFSALETPFVSFQMYAKFSVIGEKLYWICALLKKSKQN